jgi:hypothetical protein
MDGSILDRGYVMYIYLVLFIYLLKLSEEYYIWISPSAAGSVVSWSHSVF